MSIGDDDLLRRLAIAYRSGAIGRETIREEVERWLDREAPEGEAGDLTIAHPVATPAAAEPPRPEPETAGERFAVLGVHAEGGLGTVYRAVDGELGREVALKQIRAERADDPESQSRFLREGAITGALEHPGIVPVYGRGRFPDGRPFFAMRLVRGRSLREAIDEHHGGGRSEATLRALVGRLVQASYAVEYAHSRGVVHRDLKPDNIMLGPFGETLVVDWGLAKELGQGEEAPAPVEPAAPPIIEKKEDECASSTKTYEISDAAWATRSGHVRGTIGYMSPEQARGDQDGAGPATDVYGLGATLYCLLTGRPPIGLEGGAAAALFRVARGDVEPPGAVVEGVDAELERICLTAIQREPGRRFPSARALAEALDEWLAEERARSARALFASALEAYGALVTTVQERLGALPAAREAREDLLATAVAGLDGLIEHAGREQSAEVERALAEAHRQLGEIALRLGRSGEAKEHLERSLRAFEALVAAGRPEPTDRRGLAIVLGRLGDVSKRRGDGESARAYYRRGLDAARAVAAVEPRSGRAQRGLAIAYGKLGDLARRHGDPESARSYHRRALAIADALARAAPQSAEALRSLAIATDKLGDLERQLGAPEAARGYYERSLTASGAMLAAVADDPAARRGLLIAGNKLGELHRQAGDLGAARSAFERSLALAESLAAADPADVDARRDLAICCDRLGDACRDGGDLEAARSHYGRGLELARSMAEADPESAQARRGLAIALNKLGALHADLGDPVAAVAATAEALSLIEPLAAADPDDAQSQIDVAYGRQRLATLAAAAGRSDEARAHHRRAADRLRALADRGRLAPGLDRWLAELERAADPAGAGDPA